MWFDQYAGHCIVSNFRLHCDSHSQILTATETPAALTLARCNLIRLISLDWPSWRLLPAHQHYCVTSLRIIQFPCISWICIGENHVLLSLTFGLHLFPTPSKNPRFSIRSTTITGWNSTQAYMITLAEAKGAGSSSVHKAQNPKSDMSQKCVDFLSTQMSISPILPSLPFVLILSLGASFDLYLKLNHAFESISRLVRAHRPPCILHWFYKPSPHVMCVHS